MKETPMNLEDLETDAKSADAKAVSWVERHAQPALLIGLAIGIVLLVWALV
jgi:hypothetical protein